MACTLILMRHGEIKANRTRCWHGATDSPLLWRGRRQAKRLGRYVNHHYPALDALYSSPLQRCLATADPVAAPTKLRVRPDQRLAEWSIGDWEGMPFRELQEKHDFFNTTLRDLDYAPPGGESLGDVAERYVAALRGISATHERDAADTRVGIVSHGAAIQVALATLIDGTPARWQSYAISNCSITELVLTPEPYVEAYNHTHYL